MAIALTVLTLFVLLKRLAAEPIPISSSRPCVQFKIPVSVTAQNADFDLLVAKSNIDAVQVSVDIDTPSHNLNPLKNVTVSDTFKINAQLCVPPKGSKRNHLQIPTHGIFFDSRYWDVTINPSEYSYVDAALAAGYSVLTYDRLGTGQSDHPKDSKVLQAPVELEVLRGITQMARSGDLLKHVGKTPNSMTPEDDKLAVSFNKVIHIGHSYGSFLTEALTQKYSNLSDAAVMTGYFQNEFFFNLPEPALGFAYALALDPKKFGNRFAGYLAAASPLALQSGFFSTRGDAASGIGGFDPKLLDYAFSIAETFTAHEMVSARLVGAVEGPDFGGPVQFVVAELDYAVCKGDCKGLIDIPKAKKLYPKSPAVDVYFHPGNGHALTMHKKANIGYKATLDWLAKVGL